MTYLHCKFCRDDYEHHLCKVTDIIDTKTGRKYVFECPFCNQTVKSEPIIDGIYNEIYT